MVTSVRIFKDYNCDTDLSGDMIGNFDLNAGCRRTKFGISLGVLTILVGVVWLVVTKYFLKLKGSLGNKLEFALVCLMLIFWTCGVTFLTFDADKAPAHYVGNLYFFTWGSWILDLVMAIDLLQNMVYGCNEVTNNGAANEEKKNKPEAEEQV